MTNDVGTETDRVLPPLPAAKATVDVATQTSEPESREDPPPPPEEDLWTGRGRGRRSLFLRERQGSGASPTHFQRGAAGVCRARHAPRVLHRRRACPAARLRQPDRRTVRSVLRHSRGRVLESAGRGVRRSSPTRFSQPAPCPWARLRPQSWQRGQSPTPSRA